jgi:hypothetical protein
MPVIDGFQGLFSIFHDGNLMHGSFDVGRDGRPLLLRRAPGGSDLTSEFGIGRICPVEDCSGENGPGDSGAEKDEADGGDTFAHENASLLTGIASCRRATILPKVFVYVKYFMM